MSIGLFTVMTWVWQCILQFMGPIQIIFSFWISFSLQLQQLEKFANEWCLKKILFVPAVRVLSERSDQNADFQNGKEIYTATSTGFEVDIATDDLSEEDIATSEVTYINNATFNASEVKSGFIFLLQTDNSTWRK